MPASLRALIACCLLLAISAFAGGPDRRIAITVDDLPWAQLGEDAPADLQIRHARLIAALKKAGAPVTGFVNESKLEVDGKLLPERVAMLRDWRDAGFALGNHTWGHVDLHAVGMEAYKADILRGERQLRPLLAERGATPRWFRHPYLRAGRTPEDKAALSAFLAEHGYRIAPVTVDNADWVWSLAYTNMLAYGGDNAGRLARLRRDYVRYMLAKVDYYERQSQALLGNALPQIWLLHANALNAEAYGDLVDGVRARGYCIVTLDEAMRDPAYAREDRFTGRFGPSWLHRWAIAERKPREFFAGEPTTPRWVLDLAGVESE